ncbi:MAG: 3-hydroxyacyl-ACP dehydratase FabZ [Gammaproteobacteria bacterium]|nr:3-hydroxyacyl-ACP dehydratase FabZ [Gammaproteobacteria bacterium]
MTELSQLGIKDLLSLIPHRYPFILIDKVVDIEENKRIVALKNVTINEPFFQGHFPGDPVMPGVLILESMAQAACVLAVSSRNDAPDKFRYYFTAIDGARFKKPVRPGDQLVHKVSVTKCRRNLWSFKGESYVDDVLVTKAELMCAAKEL